MSKLRYIILLILFLSPAAWAQRRYAASDQSEYEISRKRGFSTRDVESQTDILFGLHASQYSGTHHLIGFSLEGGWSSFVSPMPAAKITPGGGAAGIHLLYEFQYNGFILQTGLGAAYQRVFTAVADTSIYHAGMTASWNGHDETFTLKHLFTGRCDESQQVYGQLPLYFGHYFFGAQGIGYFLAGVHTNYAFYAAPTHQKMTGTTTGLYERYVGIWEEMDNHGFRKDVPLERTGAPLKLKFDVMAHAEIGYEYNTRQGARDYRLRPSDRLDGRIRFAAFADFGILNIRPDASGDLYGIPETTIYDFPTYKTDYIFATKDAAAFWMRNLFVGVRLTFLFGFQPQDHCILCDTWHH